MKKISLLLIALVSSFSAFSQGKDVVDIAVGSTDHTTLVAAVKAAGLVATLKSEGPFTVFAPTKIVFHKVCLG